MMCCSVFCSAPEILQGLEHGHAVVSRCQMQLLLPASRIGSDCVRAQDWWTTGILLFEMLTGNVPFTATNHNELYQQTISVCSSVCPILVAWLISCSCRAR